MVIMNVEKNRLRTFEGWPANVAVEPQRIAKAGFFSTGLGLEVQCFCCGGKISEWNYGDQVMVRHRALDPQCPFVKNPIQSGNVPLIPGGSSAPPTRSNSCQPSSLTDGEGSSSSRQNNPQPSADSLSIENVTSLDDGMDFRSEAARLQSFRSWPIPFIVAPERLAKAGFYYLQQGDRVQCAFCSGVVGHWEAGDDPSTEHRRHFPSCPLHYSVPVGNVPLEQPVTAPQEPDNSVNFRPVSAPEQVTGDRGTRLTQPHEMTELGIQTHRGPRHPKYSTVESRLRTFTEWPLNMSQTPQQLAQAGFYHVGTRDQVRCFHCDGGLRHWDPDDDPWTEHARWFSLCGYVRLVKGDEFIQQAIAQHPPVLPANEDGDKMSSVVTRNEAHHKVRDVTEEELQGLMGMTPATAALQMGLDGSRIKLALRRKMEQTGLPFTTSDALIEAVLGIQMNEETIDTASSSSGSRGNSPQHVHYMNTDTDSEDENESYVGSGVQQPAVTQNPTVNKPPLIPSRSLPVMLNEQVVQQDAAESHTEQGPRRPIADANAKSMPQLPSDDSNKTRALSLEEEVRRLKEARLCKICMDEEVGVVFLPCGHLVTCVNCAPSLHDCPVCRQLIKATVRTFLS